MEEKNTARIPDGFDPNGPGIANGSYFGLPFAPEESRNAPIEAASPIQMVDTSHLI